MTIAGYYYSSQSWERIACMEKIYYRGRKFVVTRIDKRYIDKITITKITFSDDWTVLSTSRQNLPPGTIVSRKVWATV